MIEKHTQSLKLGDKFYIVTRRDLSPGYQLAQSVHAALDFSLEYPELTKDWHSISNYICLLAAKDESELAALSDRLKKKDLKFIVFTEPDLNNEITAIAIEPGKRTRRVTSSFPLALKSKVS